MIDRLEYLIQLQEANLQISANNNVLLQRILAGMDEGNAFNRGVAELSILNSNLALRKYDGCISLPQASHITVTLFISV